jgi:hypothetical protein
MGESYRTVYVYVRDAFAGTLQETDSGYSFQYDPDYLKELRLTHPKHFSLILTA